MFGSSPRLFERDSIIKGMERKRRSKLFILLGARQVFALAERGTDHLREKCCGYNEGRLALHTHFVRSGYVML